MFNIESGGNAAEISAREEGFGAGAYEDCETVGSSHI